MAVSVRTLTFEELEVVRLFSLFKASSTTELTRHSRSLVGSFACSDLGLGVALGYRLALELERLNVALVPGGRRDG